jgi:hypothetical protein
LVIPAPPPKTPKFAADPRVPGSAIAAAGMLHANALRTDMDTRPAFVALKRFIQSPFLLNINLTASHLPTGSYKASSLPTSIGELNS